MYELPPDLWPPQARGLTLAIDAIERNVDACMYAPTGGGKTRVAEELFNYCFDRHWTASFYLNRKLLLGQTYERFRAAGLPIGVRAAEWDDNYDHSAPFQLISSDTEFSRVFERKIWDLHRSNLVIVDEGHLQKATTMDTILKGHRANGARVILLTATPIGISHMVDELLISGTLQEYRDCKALVPAVFHTVRQPDMHKIKRNLTGEYVMDGVKKRIYTQHIVGDVMAQWKIDNPDARPTMLYAPDVAGSVWFAEQFRKIGVNWCHVDANDAVVDGIRAKLTRGLWEEILERYHDGSIKGLSSRFKLREGLNVPATFMCILATPIGSLASFLQTVGRVLRYSPATPDHVIVVDAGGNYLRHGSPNQDRDWQAFFRLPEHVVSEYHEKQIARGERPEPIRCPQCKGERTSGIKCPHCGFVAEKGRREVIMEDGTLEIKDGRLIRPRRVKMQPNTQELWDKMYWGWLRSSKCKDKTFAALEGFFAHTHGYHPPETLARMPKLRTTWYRKIRDVGKEELIQGAA